MGDSTKIDNGNNEGKRAENDGTDPAERTFTQAEVDSIIQGRLAKYSDYDTLKQRLADLERESQSEQERAVNDARTEARTEALREVNSRIVRAEARAVAAEMGFLYPQDAAFYVDAEAISVDDNGVVDAEAIKATLREAIKDRPALVKTDNTPPPPDNAGIGVVGDSKPVTAESAWLRDVSTGT